MFYIYLSWFQIKKRSSRLQRPVRISFTKNSCSAQSLGNTTTFILKRFAPRFVMSRLVRLTGVFWELRWEGRTMPRCCLCRSTDRNLNPPVWNPCVGPAHSAALNALIGTYYTMTSYVSFCVDTCISTKTVKTYCNNKPWVTKDMQLIPRKKTSAVIGGTRMNTMWPDTN